MSSLTPFIDREEEFSKIAEYLGNPDCRLVTVVGLGGIGKTRLVQEFLKVSNGQFPDGKYIVPLVGVDTADLIPAAITNALQVTFQDAMALEDQLLAYFKNKTLMLVLDNLEHLANGTRFISSILQTAPGVKIIVTSRERLQMKEEWLLWVRGLPYPKPPHHSHLNNHSSVTLFIEVAQHFDSEFTANEDNLPFIGRICQLVEGMPLAIELTASWVRILSCRLILKELEQGLDAAEGPMQEIPDRHRSIRTVFEYTWEQLTDTEKAVFRQLSVFRGGFQLDAAKAVASATVFDLASLMDKSLIKRTHRERYDMHELLRQYATEKLLEDNELAQDTLRRHSAYFADYLWHVEKILKTQGMPDTIFEIAQDFDNIQLGWRTACAQIDLDLILKYAYSLNFFYHAQGLYQLSIKDCTLAETILRSEASSPDRDHALARVLTYKAEAFSFFDGNYELAAENFQESLTLLESLGPFAQHDIGTAQAFYGRNQIKQRHVDEGMSFLHFALENFEKIEAPFGQWLVLSILTETSLMGGEHRDAIQHARKALHHAENFPDPIGAAFNLAMLGISNTLIGELHAARQYFRQALEINHLNLPAPFFVTLEGIALLAMSERRFEAALRFITFIQHHPLSGQQQKRNILPTLARLETQLGAETVDQITADSKALLSTPEDQRAASGLPPSLIEELMKLLQSNSPKTVTASVDRGLTKRELQVLRLLASGMTNLEIAHALVISEGTVKRHTHNIYQKMGVKNRSQAVLLAKNLNLI